MMHEKPQFGNRNLAETVIEESHIRTILAGKRDNVYTSHFR